MVQQQQIASAASSKAAAIAAKPGCASIIDLAGTSSTNTKSLSAKSTTSNEIAMKVTLTTSQKVVLIGSNFLASGGVKTFMYSSTACTDGNFTALAVSLTPNRVTTSRLEFTVAIAGSYTLYYDGSVSTGESAYIE